MAVFCRFAVFSFRVYDLLSSLLKVETRLHVLPALRGFAMARNASLDYARLIAAFGIVLFHAGAPGGVAGYAGLPFFLMLLLVLAWPAAQKLEFAAYARSRAQRLLIPFFIWSAIYGGVNLVEVLVTRKSFTQEFSASMLLTGPAIHLWFLPFAFVACLAVYPLAWAQGPLHVRIPKATARRNRLVFLAGLAGAAWLAMALRQGQVWPAPFAQWAYAFPAVCLGMGYAVAQGRPVLQLGLAGVVAGFALWAGWTDGVPQLVAAALALLICQSIRLPETPLSRLSVHAAMGVYLCHPLAASVLERTTDLGRHSLGLALATAALALLATLGAAAVRQYWASPVFDLCRVLRSLRLGRLLMLRRA